MKFRNYCIIVMGAIGNIKNEIVKIAESKVMCTDTDKAGLVIATFTSVATPLELEEYFKVNGRSFMVFDLDIKHSSVHFDDKTLHNNLFEMFIDNNLSGMNERFFNEISGITDNESTISIDDDVIVGRTIRRGGLELNGTTQKERQMMINKILDKGDMMTDNDKETIKKITDFKG